jgi:hypothetical protein
MQAFEGQRIAGLRALYTRRVGAKHRTQRGRSSVRAVGQPSTLLAERLLPLRQIPSPGEWCLARVQVPRRQPDMPLGQRSSGIGSPRSEP